MDDELYDEFGNYIGPDLQDDEEDGWLEDAPANAHDEDEDEGDRDGDVDMQDEDNRAIVRAGEDLGLSRAIVLHEDKKFYPTSEELYPEAVT
jgi:U5 small nuclear ribonucleoprotein component